MRRGRWAGERGRWRGVWGRRSARPPAPPHLPHPLSCHDRQCQCRQRSGTRSRRRFHDASRHTPSDRQNPVFYFVLRVIRVSPALYPTATVPIRSERDRMAGNGDGCPFPHGSRHGSSNDFPCVNQTPLVDQYVLCGLFVWHTVRPTGRVALSSVGRSVVGRGASSSS